MSRIVLFVLIAVFSACSENPKLDKVKKVDPFTDSLSIQTNRKETLFLDFEEGIDYKRVVMICDSLEGVGKLEGRIGGYNTKAFGYHFETHYSDFIFDLSFYSKGGVLDTTNNKQLDEIQLQEFEHYHVIQSKTDTGVVFVFEEFKERYRKELLDIYKDKYKLKEKSVELYNSYVVMGEKKLPFSKEQQLKGIYEEVIHYNTEKGILIRCKYSDFTRGDLEEIIVYYVNKNRLEKYLNDFDREAQYIEKKKQEENKEEETLKDI